MTLVYCPTEEIIKYCFGGYLCSIGERSMFESASSLWSQGTLRCCKYYLLHFFLVISILKMKYIAFILMLIGNIPNKFMECQIYSMHNWCFKLKKQQKSLLKGIWKNLMHSWKKRIFKVSCKIFHCFKNKKTSLSCDPRGRHISRPWATELCGWRLAFLSNRIDSSWFRG